MEKRSFKIEVGNIRSQEKRTVSATLSTEHPVKRWDGEEVLSHTAGAVDLSRAPLPLITGHDEKRLPVGIVENLKIVGGKLKGILRISESQDQIWGDIKAGILRNLSIGYLVKNRKRTAKGFLVTNWLPYECSLVAAGADPMAGINRSIRKENKKMDRNDVLKAKKRALDELTELAMTENLDEAAETRFGELKAELRSLDTRLEMMEAVRDGEADLKNRKPFSPELDDRKQDRSILNAKGGAAHDRSFAGMFNQGREIQIDEDEVKRFRAQMVEGVSSAGGFAVPEPLAAKWLDDSLPNEIIRPRATVWPMTAETRKVPGWDNSDQSSSFFGGFAMEFLSETGTGTKQTGKLRMVTLTARKGAIFVDISNELKEDGQGFESQLEMAIKKSLGLGMDYHFLQGSGAGQPLGILSADSVIQVAKETGQAADTLNFQNVSKMFARMYPAGRSRAVWIANETCIPQLMTGMTVAVGTGGSWVNVFKESNGNFTLLGRPVIFTPNLPVLGDAGDLIFCDLSQYAIGLRRDLRLEKSNIPGWTQDLMSYRVIARFDGMPTWDAAITPKNGDSLSWCVKLAARA